MLAEPTCIRESGKTIVLPYFSEPPVQSLREIVRNLEWLQVPRDHQPASDSRIVVAAFRALGQVSLCGNELELVERVVEVGKMSVAEASTVHDTAGYEWRVGPGNDTRGSGEGSSVGRRP